MNRQQAKDMLPIIQALAEGRHIQLKDTIGNWIDIDFINVEICNPNNYRIKPFKYYPFKNAEECWAEMQKHQPFGWVKWNDVLYNIYVVSSTSVCLINGNCEHMDFAYAYQKLEFADGTPFGIKEE